MTESVDFEELVQEIRELVRQAGHNRRRVLHLSPEVAAQLDQVPAAAPEGPLEADPALPEDGGNLGEAGALEELEQTVRECRRCPLAATCTNKVFGVGHPRAKLVFVGEAPGHDEDLQGKPFVGRAGHLLTDIIEKGMKLKRSEVYICNVLKCRPPNNRTPLPSEVEACEPYLVRQMEVLRPRVICALGATAAQTLLKTHDPIGKLRGKWHFYHGIPLRATYHPAYLLRNPADKRKTWDDVREVLKVYHGEFTPSPDP